MNFQKITPRKIYEEIAEQLKTHILDGGWKSGDRLPSTKELSEQFQVGRSTMREALSALKAMGLIEIRHGDGCFVRSVEAADIRMPEFDTRLLSREAIFELLEARIALEVSNASLAARRRTEADLTAFRELLQGMRDQLGNESFGESSDLAFHRLLAEAAHNTILVRLLETIASQLEAAIKEARRIQLYGNQEVALRLLGEHEAIFAAIEQQDAHAAESRMRTHLAHVEGALRNHFDMSDQASGGGRTRGE